MNLKQLKYFQLLAKTQHYTSTSDYFSISQPSLSHSISELEKEIGIKLFQKRGRNVELTKEGKQYLTYVEQALNALSEGEQFVKELLNVSHGHIGLAFIYSISSNYIPKIIKAFLAEPENNDITFSFYEGTSQNIIEGLREKKYEIGICSHLQNEPDVHFRKLTKQELVFIISNDHPLSKRKKLDLKELIHEPLILFNEKNGIKTVIDDMLTKTGLQPNIACHVETESAMMGLASINYGIGIMPRVLIPEEFNVTLVPMNKCYQKRDIFIATMKNRPLLPAPQKFYHFLIEHSDDAIFGR
ncbi:LysR family transcriptional regulator [Gilliamella sp. B2776]|uniref:LysR family transcriptional regulator n=1 Tax=unclassified Gilliamella TaxID=2685620 RepID=UPI00226A64E0|nr:MULTISPECIES: LysR family transcriptional regulator [unclassified Gilliamella]MCX8650595.1 LysR family transcriptional regulator [Gilliamella sp. B2779]MCX8654282.1 LysR family transcriptional regulator [Gilliamella sp. B2737]MCX8656835.1 LysR family transcriptional regulator [Gilliamella sp. B2894]MCX8665537.1 LysR family transcriptional regulator [Gilliamella sp. B2887]MCX8692443.1 LysR family transcriptional regulator [Gilliamella sp. B2776]